MLVHGIAQTLVTAAGEPILPQAVVQCLRKYPRLSVQWVGGQVRQWGLRQRWPQGDPRWEHVQTGRLPESQATDFLQVFPEDCRGEEMAGFIERYYGERNQLSKADAAKEATKIVEQQISKDQKQMESNVSKTHASSVERHERESRHALRVRAGVEKAHPMVTVK